jgi:hypothetical protein
MNELNNLLSNYFLEVTDIFFDEDDILSVSTYGYLHRNFFSRMESFEKPDIYAKKDNALLIIEHFEFDSSNKSKKGSQERINNFRFNNDFEKAMNSAKCLTELHVATRHSFQEF